VTTKHYSFESATALLAVRNTQNEDVEEKRGGEAVREQDTSMKIRTHEQALHCISDVMHFAIDLNSSSLNELLYTVKDCIQKDITKKWKQISFLDLWKKSQLLVYWKCAMCSVGLQVSPTYKSQGLFSHINRYIPFNMILMNFFFFFFFPQFCMMRKLGQWGKYIRSLAIPL
jgi:hypothetical protein